MKKILNNPNTSKFSRYDPDIENSYEIKKNIIDTINKLKIGSIIHSLFEIDDNSFLKCDGGVKLQEDYPKLYEILTTLNLNFNDLIPIDPDTQFRLPDFRGKLITTGNLTRNIGFSDLSDAIDKNLMLESNFSKTQTFTSVSEFTDDPNNNYSDALRTGSYAAKVNVYKGPFTFYDCGGGNPRFEDFTKFRDVVVYTYIVAK